MTTMEKRQTDEARSRCFVGSIMWQAFSPLACGVWRQGLRSCSRSFSTIVVGFRLIPLWLRWQSWFFDYRRRTSTDFGFVCARGRFIRGLIINTYRDKHRSGNVAVQGTSSLALKHTFDFPSSPSLSSACHAG